MKSFREYVKSHSPEDSPAGDFLRDAKHPSSNLPDAKSWDELETYLVTQGAIGVAVDAAKNCVGALRDCKAPIGVPLARGYTVRDLIELLQKENPDVHVIKYHDRGASTSRVEGFSQVTIQSGSKELPAIMLE